MATNKTDDLPSKDIEAKHASQPMLEQVEHRQPPATVVIDFRDPVVLNVLSLYASKSLDEFFVDRYGNNYGMSIYKSHFKSIVNRLEREKFFAIQLFNNHADFHLKNKLICAILAINTTGYDLRIPALNSFVDFCDGSFKINISTFVEQFDVLNSVSVASASPPSPPLPEDERSRNLDALIASVPNDAGYEKKAENLAGLSHEFRQRLAVELAPALNAHIQGMPHDTYEEKKELARWVNAEVERFGLAVKCPKTGLPATLRTHPGNWADIGRFAFEVYIGGKRKVPSYSDKLPELQLIDATTSQGRETPEIASETPWQDEVGPKPHVAVPNAPEPSAKKISLPS